MEIQIRRAAEGDLERVKELLVQVNAVHHAGRPDIFRGDGAAKYTDGQLLAIFGDDSRPVFVAADEDGRVVGYAFCVIIDAASNVLNERRELYIDDLCADAECRRQGIGSRLFDFVKEYAKEIGCYHLTLNVWALNESAMAFYDRQGMRMLKKEMELIL